MRIHTNLTSTMLYDAARPARVDFARFDTRGSRTRRFGHDLILTGSSGRHSNSGRYGAIDGLEGMAATWDEWGIFLNAIFALDPIAHCSYYMGADDFEWKTGGRYEDLVWDEQCSNHVWHMSVPREQECKKDCGAIRRWSTRESLVIRPTGNGFTTSDTVPPRGRRAAEEFIAS